MFIQVLHKQQSFVATTIAAHLYEFSRNSLARRIFYLASRHSKALHLRKSLAIIFTFNSKHFKSNHVFFIDV